MKVVKSKAVSGSVQLAILGRIDLLRLAHSPRVMLHETWLPPINCKHKEAIVFLSD